MAANNFEASLVFVFEDEGGFTLDPNDPGGATNFGVTHTDLARWRGVEVTVADVQNMTQEEATTIMRSFYWDTMGCKGIPLGLDYCVMDFGLHSGTHQALVLLWDMSARIDPANISAAITEYCHARLAYVSQLPVWQFYADAFTTRIQNVEQRAIAMLQGGG